TAGDNGYGNYTIDASELGRATRRERKNTVEALNAGDSTTESFTVHTADGTAQIVTVTIHGTNDAAVVSGTSTGSVTEAGGVANGTPGTPTASGTLTDSDVDNAANTFQAVASPTAGDNGYGNYTIDASGHWSYTLDNANTTVQALNAGYSTTDTSTAHTYALSLHDALPIFHGTNDAAVVSGTSTGSVTEA